MLTIWIISRLIWRISNTQRKCYHQYWVHCIRYECRKNLENSLWRIHNGEFTIMRYGKETWKKCKLLGVLLDTKEDVKWRKVLALNVVNSMKEISFEDIIIKVKVRSFNCYVSSVFLFNCMTRKLRKTLKSTIDSFQRSLLRIVDLNFKW